MLGLTSSSSLKIKEKIKMKRTAEDLVIVYLEAKIATMRGGAWGSDPRQERSSGCNQRAEGEGAEPPDFPEGNWLCSRVQCIRAQNATEGGLSYLG